jgi:hypothetical protein
MSIDYVPLGSRIAIETEMNGVKEINEKKKNNNNWHIILNMRESAFGLRKHKFNENVREPGVQLFRIGGRVKRRRA